MEQKFGIWCVNCGIMNHSTWMKRDGEILLFDTRIKALQEASKHNNRNPFNSYFAKEYE